MILTGISGFCSDSCLKSLQQRAREKNARKLDRKSQVIENKKAKRGPNYRRKRRSVQRALKDAVLSRDGRRCRRCGRNTDLEVHHIRYRSQGGRDEERNLITLCLRDHQLVHSDKKVWQPVLLELVRRYYDLGQNLYVGQVQSIMRRERDNDGT